jgi:guanine deaminase
MADSEKTGRISAIRGAALTFTGNPFTDTAETCMTYLSDSVLVMAGGRIAQFGPADGIIPTLGPDVPVERYPDSLILPGFIDCHVHYPQTRIIGAGGEPLIDWLDKFAYVAEQAFDEPDHARQAARHFFDETLRNGTTTAAVFCTVHPGSVDAFFLEAEKRAMRMIGGKVLMDRHAPAALTDSAQAGYDESKALIERWHGRDRLHYAITPRFAASSTPDQLAAAGALWREYPTAYVQSHLAETPAENAWVAELYPDRAGYLDVYDHFGLIGERSLYGHGIYLTESEWQLLSDTGTAIAHCPTSNLFLGSGLFDIGAAKKPGRPVRVGLATDLGAGTSFSMLQTMAAAYKVARMNSQQLSASQALYLATRGAAEALSLHDKIGSLAPGMDADVIVLDLKSTSLIDYRMQFTDTLEEALFVQMILGDDRAIRATYIAGEIAHQRDYTKGR